jgi:calcium-dependent protein kinase
MGELHLSEEPITDFYIMGKIIGSGKYGVVRKGTSIKNSNFNVAVKVIDMSKLSSQFHSLIQEILTLKKVDHPNIVSIYEMYKDDEKLYLVMEYVEGQELFDFISQRFKLLESEASEIIEQLVKAIRYLNTLGVCHRDLKPENIIINQNTLQIKLIDFGLSAYFDEVSQLRSKVGTPYYVAPEVLEGDYNKECDMWSIGIITYILLVGYPPFNSSNMKVIYEKIKKGK